MRVMLVFSHGGHFTEMRELMDCFAGCEISYLTYRSPATASLSNASFLPPFRYSALWLYRALRVTWRHVARYRPQVVVSTGAEPAVPAFLISKLLCRSRLAYLECSAQVYSPSLTGRLLYPLADLFLVQWDSLLRCYGRKARFVGGLL